MSEADLSIQDKLREILRAQGSITADIDRLTPDSDLYREGLTSLALVDLMLAIEQAFDVEFPEAALNRRTFASIGAMEGIVSGLLNGNRA